LALQPAGSWQHTSEPVHAAPPLHSHTAVLPDLTHTSPDRHCEGVVPHWHTPVLVLHEPTVTGVVGTH
jgi:hypothetical protein